MSRILWSELTRQVDVWMKRLRSRTTKARIVAVLAVLACLDPEHDLADVIAFLHLHCDESAWWTGADYAREFAAIPELTELTNTPFTVEIVTAILQRLKLQLRTLSEIKSQLAITLDEETAEKAWALLRNKHFLENLTTIQNALDVGSDPSKRDQWTNKIHDLAESISNPVLSEVNSPKPFTLSLLPNLNPGA